jgi:hypothetical protein
MTGLETLAIGAGSSIIGSLFGGGQKTNSGGLPSWYTNLPKEGAKILKPTIMQQWQDYADLEPQRRATVGQAASLIPEMTAKDLGVGAFDRSMSAGQKAFNQLRGNLSGSGVNGGSAEAYRNAIMQNAAVQGANESAAQQNPTTMLQRIMQALQLYSQLQDIPALRTLGSVVTAQPASVSQGNPLGNALIAGGSGLFSSGLGQIFNKTATDPLNNLVRLG